MEIEDIFCPWVGLRRIKEERESLGRGLGGSIIAEDDNKTAERYARRYMRLLKEESILFVYFTAQFMAGTYFLLQAYNQDLAPLLMNLAK
jgi:hypothetical protein